MESPRPTPFYCPTCGTPIKFDPGLCGNRFIEAIMLQSERLGVEITCSHCQSTFIYSKLESIQRLRDRSDPPPTSGRDYRDHHFLGGTRLNEQSQEPLATL